MHKPPRCAYVPSEIECSIGRILAAEVERSRVFTNDRIRAVDAVVPDRRVLTLLTNNLLFLRGNDHRF